MLLVLLITMVCCRYFILKSTNEKLDQQRIVKRSQTELTAEKKYSEVGRDSIVCPEENSVQYDPNSDFAIFGVGNPKTGGIQGMSEKMNVDQVAEESSSQEEDQDPNDNVPPQQLPEDKEIYSDSELS